MLFYYIYFYIEWSGNVFIEDAVFRYLILHRGQASFPSSCEVAENQQRIHGAALIRVNVIETCRTERRVLAKKSFVTYTPYPEGFTAFRN